MELTDVIRRRRMVRAFQDRPVPAETVDSIVDLARRSPSAGNTQPWSFVVLEGGETGLVWDVTLPPERRTGFRWQGLLKAPVLILPLVSSSAYVRRYSEDDKVQTGLGEGAEAWPVPYWWVDGGMAVHALLLGAVDVGLGASLFGLFGHERAVLEGLGVPEEWRALGAVALGWPAEDEPGRSVNRLRPPLGDVIHRGGMKRR